MAKASIYVSEELRARMVEVGEALNWSEIARPAFEQAIAEHQSKKGQAMSAIDRLKVSKEKYIESVVTNGHKYGRKWASERASFYELRELSKLNVNAYEYNTAGITVAIYNTIDPDQELDYDSWKEDFLGNPNVNEDFVFNFAKGAQELFAEVEDEL